jgi:hypothetical protein
VCNDLVRPHSKRYADDILALHDRLNFRSLLSLPPQECAYQARRADGLLTLGLRTDQLDHRHLLALQGFRLAQYLKLGWICQDLIAARGMFCEPSYGVGEDDLHMVTVSPTGEILGFLGLAASADPEGVELRDPKRWRFPVERAHGVDLADHIGEGTVHSRQVRELKRFVHRRSMTDPELRMRVTLELLLAAAHLIGQLPSTRWVVGDLEEQVALRHLVLVGLDVRLIEGTSPHLAGRDYLHPAYTKRGPVKPFIAAVPDPRGIADRARQLAHALSSPTAMAGTRSMLTGGVGPVQRVAA